jgi:hypothetical protein
VKCDIAVADIGRDDLVFDAGGIGAASSACPRKIPMPQPSRRIVLKDKGDNALRLPDARGWPSDLVEPDLRLSLRAVRMRW